MTLQKEESIFFESMATGGFNTLQWMVVHPEVHRQCKLDLMGYWKENQRRRRWDWVLKELTGGLRVDVAKIHRIKFSRN